MVGTPEAVLICDGRRRMTWTVSRCRDHLIVHPPRMAFMGCPDTPIVRNPLGGTAR